MKSQIKTYYSYTLPLAAFKNCGADLPNITPPYLLQNFIPEFKSRKMARIPVWLDYEDSKTAVMNSYLQRAAKPVLAIMEVAIHGIAEKDLIKYKSTAADTACFDNLYYVPHEHVIPLRGRLDHIFPQKYPDPIEVLPPALTSNRSVRNSILLGLCGVIGATLFWYLGGVTLTTQWLISQGLIAYASELVKIGLLASVGLLSSGIALVLAIHNPNTRNLAISVNQYQNHDSTPECRFTQNQSSTYLQQFKAQPIPQIVVREQIKFEPSLKLK